MSGERPGFPGLSSHEARDPFQVATRFNTLLLGKLNAVLGDFHIDPAVGPNPYPIEDERITAQSFVAIMSDQDGTGFYVSSIADGQLQLGWSTSGWSTARIRLLVIG